MAQPLWNRFWQVFVVLFSWIFKTELNIVLLHIAVPLLDIYLTDLQIYVTKKKLHMNVYSRFIHNYSKLEATKISLNRLMNKQVKKKTIKIWAKDLDRYFKEHMVVVV